MSAGKRPTPLRDAYEEAKAKARAAWADDEVSAEDAEIADRLADEAKEAWLASDELRPYALIEDGYEYRVIEASSVEEALKVAVASVDRSNYDGDRTLWIHVEARCEESGESEGETVALEPDEPDCLEGEPHEWMQPHSVLGGLRENPGVLGHGGGVICREVCGHCGAYRVTDTWAQDTSTGEQGLTSIEYEEADEASLRWARRRRDEVRS